MIPIEPPLCSCQQRGRQGGAGAGPSAHDDLCVVLRRERRATWDPAAFAELCRLYCLDESGAELWRFPTSGWVRSAPVVADDGRILFGSNDGRLYCLQGRPEDNE